MLWMGTGFAVHRTEKLGCKGTLDKPESKAQFCFPLIDNGGGVQRVMTALTVLLVTRNSDSTKTAFQPGMQSCKGQ